MSEVFTDDDLKSAEHYETLGPAYFAARRLAERVMAGVGVEPLHNVATKAANDVRDVLYDYVETHLRSDLESNLEHHIRDMVERTVRALLIGEDWALKQYPLSKYHDGEMIRAAVAKHIEEPVAKMRIAELETELSRVNESLKWALDRGRY